MSAFLPPQARGSSGDGEHPQVLEHDLDQHEIRARWAVRAAQWRARELAEVVFGQVGDSTLRSLRTAGAARGLLTLDVPFQDLETHRDREAIFMAAAGKDPILSTIPLVYVFGAST